MSISPFSLLPDRFKRTKCYAQNSFVFKQGTLTSGLMRLKSGVVSVQRVSRDGKVSVMHKVSAGEMFAEASLFTDRYHCDAFCVEACNVEWVDKYQVFSEMNSNPLFSISLMEYMAQRLQGSRELLELRNVPSAEERILAGIRLGLMTDTIAAFAEHIGITHAACYRGLRNLSEQGQVTKTGRGQYAIADSKKRASG